MLTVILDTLSAAASEIDLERLALAAVDVVGAIVSVLL